MEKIEVAKGVFLINPVVFGSNTYFIDNLLIDPGTGLPKEAKKLSVSTILNTHCHIDHTFCNQFFPNACICMHRYTAEIYEKKQEELIANKYFHIPFPKFKIGRKLEDGERINGLTVMHTPGHTHDSVCFYDEKRKILFSGDTVFSNGYLPRTDFPTSSFSDLLASYKKLSTLPINIICPGHEKIIYDKNYIKKLLNSLSKS